MKRRGLRVLATVVAGGLATVVAGPVGAQEPATSTVLVTYATEGGTDRATAEGGSLDAADDGAAEIAGRVAVAELTPAEAADIANDPGVLAVEPDSEVFAAEAPNDPCYVAPPSCPPVGAWHVDRIGLPGAWDVSHGNGVIIAVVDGGLDEANPVPDLVGKLVGELDMTGGAPECPSHATYGATLAGAGTNNGIRIPGAGWDARILSVQVMSFAGGSCGGALATVISGISAAVNNGADVINLSLTSKVLTAAMQAAIDDVIARGVPVVAAAGNETLSDPSGGVRGGYPAAYPPVISVGATTSLDQLAGFSNRGPWVDVFAPGAGLQDPLGFGTIDGTSFAAPIVSGVVALLLAVRPTLTPAAIEDILERTADPVSGGVRLDAHQALTDTPFTSLAGAGPGVVGSGPGTIEVVTTSKDGGLWHRRLGGTSAWEPHGGAIVGDPDVATSSPGRVDIVARSADNAAWYRGRVNGTWRDWALIGGSFSSSLSVVSWGPGRLDIFGRGADGALWHSYFNGSTFSGWIPLGGSLASEPDAAAFGPGQLGVFARGNDGAIWYRRWNGSTWLPWASLGGVLTSGPGAVSWGVNRFDVVARGQDGAVWHRPWNGSVWGPWNTLGGTVTSAADIGSRGAGSLDVLARAPDGYLWRRTFAGAWTAWYPA